MSSLDKRNKKLFTISDLNVNPRKFNGIIKNILLSYNKRNYKEFRMNFDNILQEALPYDILTPILEDIFSSCGEILQIRSPLIYKSPNPKYEFILITQFERCTLDMRLEINNKGKIIGLKINDFIPVHESNQTTLQLPFKGTWKVFWGGDTIELNKHWSNPSQRFAFDFVVDENNKTHSNRYSLNEDYLAFGKEVLAPANGEVIDVINGVRDNIPGSSNPYSALGNAIFIKHQDYEISVIAHLQHGSTMVNAGDYVRTGDILGLCGNSGNSSEPHIHYHLENTRIMQNAIGIKCLFSNIIVIKNNKEIKYDMYSPKKGEFVRTRDNI